MFQWLMRAISIQEMSQGSIPEREEPDDQEEQWKEQKHNKTLKKMVTKARAETIEACDKLSKERYDAIDKHIQEHRDIQMRIRAFKQKKSSNDT